MSTPAAAQPAYIRHHAPLLLLLVQYIRAQVPQVEQQRIAVQEHTVGASADGVRDLPSSLSCSKQAGVGCQQAGVALTVST